MTTLAWDGVTLAADKQTTDGSHTRTTTKIRRLRGGALGGAAGRSGVCRELLDWYEMGAAKDKMPAEADRCTLLVIERSGQIFLFEDGSPGAIEVLDKHVAIGSGADFAMAAMHLGHDAVRAVEVASHFDSSTGCGIDAITLAG
jgi:ATP-dependent protease HslVU (ClpYQ) peptidase subunit